LDQFPHGFDQRRNFNACCFSRLTIVFEQVFEAGGWTSSGKNGDRAVVWWQEWGCSVAWRNHKAPTSNEWERTGDRGRQGAKNWVGIFCQTPQQGQGGFGKKRRKYLRINNGEKWGTKYKM
jgi:hypothetical protein